MARPARAVALALAVVAALVVVAVAPAARAEAPPEVKEQFRRATAMFDLGRYGEAAALYEQTYAIYPDPVFLYNIAQSWRLAADEDKAVFFYRTYLRKQPDSPKRAQIETQIAELEALLASRKRDVSTEVPGYQPPPPTVTPVRRPTPPRVIELRPTPPSTPTAPTVTPGGGEPSVTVTETQTGGDGTPAAIVDPAGGGGDGPSDGPKASRSYWYVWALVGVVIAGGAGAAVWYLTRSQAATWPTSFPDVGPGVNSAALVRF